MLDLTHTPVPSLNATGAVSAQPQPWVKLVHQLRFRDCGPLLPVGLSHGVTSNVTVTDI